MKKIILTLTLIITGSCFGQMFDFDPTKIEVYITPYYNSEGPAVNVGKFSTGLMSKDKDEFLSTISAMKNNWTELSVEELYVAAIRLYDQCYRDESVYWFYTAQVRSRVFLRILDQSKMGGMGSAAFELTHAQNSFYQLIGPYINGYAFGDIDKLVEVLKKVQKEGVPDLASIYSEVDLIPKEQREAASAEIIIEGMNGYIDKLQNEKESIKKKREDAGLSEKFRRLKNKKLTIESSTTPVAPAPLT